MGQDETLRRLARKAAETGSLDDEVELIRARVRAGVTLQRHVEAAAYLGHAGALSAFPEARDRRRSRYAKTLDQFNTWLAKLEPRGEDVMLRASVAALRKVCSLPEARLTISPQTLVQAELWALGGAEPDPASVAPGLTGHAAYMSLACRGVVHFANAGKCRLLMSAIRDEVIPWAIGSSDPIEERHQGVLPPITCQPEPPGGYIPF